MKVVPTNDRPKKQALLPLIPDEDEPMDSSNSVCYTLRVTPANDDSPTFKKYIRVLAGGESVRVCLQWSRDSTKVVTGLAISDAEPLYELYKNLLTGSALTLMETQVNKECQEAKDALVAGAANATDRAAASNRTLISFLTDRMVNHGKQAVMRGLIPNKIVAMVKRYLRRECRKPADMKIRTYYQHLLRINESELPLLPPFDPAQNLPPDELVDILIYATPKSWMREMDRQGFDPITKSPIEVVNFQERIEQSEDFDGTVVDRSQRSSSSSGNKKKKARTSNTESKGTKFCLKHGKCNHTSDECEYLKKQVENSNSSSSGGKFGNKTWSRKADDAKKSSKKELAAFVKKAVAAKVKKELNSLDKKRKSSSDDDSFDLNAFDKELEGFNYKDMENLSIDDASDGEISV